MSNFFDFNFNIVDNSSNINSPANGSSYGYTGSGAIAKKPFSHFFTEPDLIDNQTADMAFGPQGNTDVEKQKKFLLTNIFKAKENTKPKAYAVTKGILFIVPQKGNANLVNVFLKPITPVDIGLKVKYYVYRSIKAENIIDSGDFKKIIGKNDEKTLGFIKKIWDEFQEFHQLNDTDPNLIIYSEKLGISQEETSNYSSFFTKDKFSLPIINRGDHIGNFNTEFGFEIVVDEGDFAQDKNDTGFEFEDDFFTAKKCILNIDSDNGEYEYGDRPFVLPIQNEQPKRMSINIFRESVYKFLDPVAYYGSHITANSATNKGTIFIKESESYSDPKIIYEKIIIKFFNSKKTYLYIKNCNNRSYNFYKKALKPLKINGKEENFNYSEWPIKCLEKEFIYRISFENISTINCAVFCNIGIPNSSNGNGLYGAKELLIDSKDPTSKSTILFTIPNSANIPFSSIIYLSYTDETNVLNKLFGNINLKTIFEKEDFKGGTGSFVNHLRPILIKEGDNIGFYQTKLVLDGEYISSTDPENTTPTLEQLSTNLRTYILFPQITTLGNDSFKLSAGYYNTPKDAEDYCKNIYGEGEIWRGIIKDSVDVNSLLYRRKDNDEGMPIYQLGITQKDYRALIDDVYRKDNNATNLFFHFENYQVSGNSSFIIYDVKIQFDTENGASDFSDETLSLYTVDNYFFFTIDYSTHFITKEYFKEFAEIAVDFLPINLSTTNNGYECGFDYIGFEGRENYNEVIGKYYNKSSGKLENLDVSKATDYEFRKKINDYLMLLSRNYNHKPTLWRTNPPFHTDSFITLYPLKETTIRLNFTKIRNPTKLFIRYNRKYISINNSDSSEIDEFADYEIPSSNYLTSLNPNFTIKVKSFQPTSFDIPIEIYSIEDSKTLLAGKCWILKNSETYILKTILVNVQTNVSGIIKNGLPTSDIILTKKILNNFLNQAYLKVEDDYIKTISLDLTNDSDFKVVGGTLGKYINSYIDDAGTKKYTIKDSNDVFEYCITKIKDQITNVNDYLVLFFFDEEGGNSGTTAGIADSIGGLKGARVYSNGLKRNTIAHEALHSIALYHSFDNDGDYTYRISWLSSGIIAIPSPYPTDNLMDYFQFKPTDNDKLRKLIWKWQIKKILKIDYGNSKLIKEK
ncbi:hypothetical protein [Epilithonimonas arachidiradicis]|uniref:Uncharacterized protein n=1 Tax=Epilithonimonas arachidiradicis TaxID=1617282 RepID=A0A420CMM7_9FLAO|nr:hypothetical protein [Epilithonimonas arachidiradicis]RKE79651.1 hypothetical protein BXY58_3310 [Epilithonimonas arachidiradicis]GGG67368.1 hypothetical protein GCM10007332_32770 [Epilithonimonas arachidiradicis]